MKKKLKIAFFESGDLDESYFKRKFKNAELIFLKEELNEKTVKLVKDIDIACIFIYSELNKKILSRLKNLKRIVTRSTGYDHIDINECRRRNIEVLNVPRYGCQTVAEHTFALILDLSRKIHNSYERTIKGDFSLEGLRGFDLNGKTLGIIGLGNIGKRVAKIANGFDMKIIAYNRSKDINLAGKYNIKYVSLKYLLKNSDIITLHIVYSKKTHHLINTRNINYIKKGSYLINTSRGEIVETKALVKALLNKKLNGVGLDVLEEESLIKERKKLISEKNTKEDLQNLLENHLLLTFENVIITPHNAFNSNESIQRRLDTTIHNINCLINNKKCINLVK